MLVAAVLFIAAVLLIAYNDQLTTAVAGGPLEFLSIVPLAAGVLLGLAAERAWRALEVGTALSRAGRRSDPGPE